jgi:hypothetical protein
MKRVVLDKTPFYINIVDIVGTKTVPKSKSNTSKREMKNTVVFKAFVYLITIRVGCIIHNSITKHREGVFKEKLQRKKFAAKLGHLASMT